VSNLLEKAEDVVDLFYQRVMTPHNIVCLLGNTLLKVYGSTAPCGHRELYRIVPLRFLAG